MIEFLSYYSGAFRMSAIIAFVFIIVSVVCIFVSMELEPSKRLKDLRKILVILAILSAGVFIMGVDDEVRHYTESQQAVCK